MQFPDISLVVQQIDSVDDDGSQGALLFLILAGPVRTAFVPQP